MSNKLRALGVGTKGRLKEVPGVPAIAVIFSATSGLRGLVLFAPAGTPPQIVNKIYGTFAALVREPELRDRMIGLGMYPVANTPAEFASFLETDARQWERVIRDAKMQKIEQRGLGSLQAPETFNDNALFVMAWARPPR